ncbi:MAG: hypothetical protein GF408_04750 [Candidatus Omnitrophica bacterium]|nr:hypothetical protein [Candidatus Omnitrophota bacterium]
MLAEIIFALLIAMAVTGIFAIALKKRGPWGAVWMFFIVIFLVSWAGSVWLITAGPVFFGVSWLSVLILAVIVALVLVVAMPPRTPLSIKEAGEREKQKEKAESVFDLFFWMLVFLLVFAIFAGYWAVPGAY